MATITGIVNSALRKISAKPIVNLSTDTTKNANIARDLYDPRRLALLRGHPWNFAKERAKLAQVGTAPVFGYDHAYTLPSDYIRVHSVHDNDRGVGDVRYRIQGKTLLSDADAIWLDYVRDVSDPNLMSADFREALAADLAHEMAIPIAESNTLAEAKKEDAEKALRKAKSADAMEDYPDEMPPGSWFSERNR